MSPSPLTNLADSKRRAAACARFGGRFSDASTREGERLRGASWGAAGSEWVHQKGHRFHRLRGPFFSPDRNRLGNRLGGEFSQWRHPMENRELALIGRLDGPAAVPMQIVSQCKSYRDAVRMAWALRRIPGMTKAMLAHFADLTPQHVSDYLATDDNPGRRDLPADAISRFEGAVGNTLVSQWVARQSQLTVLEEMQATRAAA